MASTRKPTVTTERVCNWTIVWIAFLFALLLESQLSPQESLKLTQLNHTSWTAREGAPSEIAGFLWEQSVTAM
jgi:hypothetical protein